VEHRAKDLICQSNAEEKVTEPRKCQIAQKKLKCHLCSQKGREPVEEINRRGRILNSAMDYKQPRAETTDRVGV